ncbi:MAG: pyridoxal 5'-phosphate synthase glutaminase subunit PdxT [Acidimicrobiales bacterium]|nr:pyridoxal 5'-phosphate synthase glutaminase subunit PdxT [Acidimicrobiales bacterium]
MSAVVGVLALQGASREHTAALERLGVIVQQVRLPQDLVGIDALVIPGGESTTISMLLESSGTFEPMAQLLHEGLPVLGTCAGMILLAGDVLDGRPDQKTFAQIDIAVRRNGFGRQVASFESDLKIEGFEEPFPGVFIRAPVVQTVDRSVEVLASVELDGGKQSPALCRQGNVIVSSFHPELTDDLRIHQMFLANLN